VRPASATRSLDIADCGTQERKVRGDAAAKCGVWGGYQKRRRMSAVPSPPPHFARVSPSRWRVPAPRPPEGGVAGAVALRDRHRTPRLTLLPKFLSTCSWSVPSGRKLAKDRSPRRCGTGTQRASQRKTGGAPVASWLPRVAPWAGVGGERRERTRMSPRSPTWRARGGGSSRKEPGPLLAIESAPVFRHENGDSPKEHARYAGNTRGNPGLTTAGTPGRRGWGRSGTARSNSGRRWRRGGPS